MDWGYWRSVLIVTLVVMVVILLYRNILRWIGGNARFDHKYAFLFPIEENGSTLSFKFELPEKDTVSLLILNDQNTAEVYVLNEEKLAVGTYEYTIDASQLSGANLTCVLKTRNQSLERFFKR